MQEESLAHTKWECTYHIVLIPKYRSIEGDGHAEG